MALPSTLWFTQKRSELHESRETGQVVRWVEGCKARTETPVGVELTLVNPDLATPNRAPISRNKLCELNVVKFGVRGNRKFVGIALS